MRVFVDVGAHYGEALEVALDPAWGFDRIFLLEPASACQSLLRKFRDERIIINPVALGAKNGIETLYGAGQLGASLFRAKPQKASAAELKNERIEVVRAREWFDNNIPPDAEVYMKFNCEGAECDIIDELLDGGFAHQLTSLYIDFDVRKIDHQAHRQGEVEAKLRKLDVPYRTPEELGLNGASGVGNWLALDCPREQPTNLARLSFWLGLNKPAYLQFRRIVRSFVPKRAYWWLGRRFGRLGRNRG
jgi:FkbM family methyltransferase